MSKKNNIEKDTSTEEKIKIAAKKLFTQKGFAATRTRDISEEANINLALLNYYFRSKEKLFEIIMRENIMLFMSGIVENIHNNKNLSFEVKIEFIIDRYIDMLIANPDLPNFILSISKTKNFLNENDDDPIFIGFKEMRTTFMKSIIEEMSAKK